MATVNPEFKNQFVVKYLELQLAGLEQYAKYLNQQLKLSGKHDNWEAYKKYIEKEIIRLYSEETFLDYDESVKEINDLEEEEEEEEEE